MKFSVGNIEHEEQWGGDYEDKEFTTLEELIEFIKQAQSDGGYVFRFTIYDPPKVPNEDYVGYITICEDDE